MNRRAFLRAGLGTSLLSIFNPVKALSVVGLDALKPVIEIGTPLRPYRGVAIANGGDPVANIPQGLPPNAPVGSSIGFDDLVTNLVSNLEFWEKEHPGVKLTVLRRLSGQVYGVPWERIEKLLWRNSPDGSVWLGPWEHHAWMVAEVGKP